jgi:hypothetical protein
LGKHERKRKQKRPPRRTARSLGRKRPRRAAGPRRHRDPACPCLSRCTAQCNRRRIGRGMHRSHMLSARRPAEPNDRRRGSGRSDLAFGCSRCLVGCLRSRSSYL